MSRFYVIAFAALFTFSISFTSDAASSEADYAKAANDIRQLFDSNFVSLKLHARNHYAARMYRLTGESYYGEQAISEVHEIHNRLDYFLKDIENAEFREAQAQKLIDKLPNTKRGNLRRQVLKNTTDERFALYLLYQLAKLNEYGVTHPDHSKFISYLLQVPLRNLLLSEQFIHAYAAQVANYIYWLADLKIVDYRLAFFKAFAQAYPNSEDESLSKSQFQNKIYGLTHIVLAASRYYQQTLDKEEFRWITDYFAKHLDRILDKTKADVHAEVGLSFMLTGQANHKAVGILKHAIKNQIDPLHKMILSPRGNTDLSLGEHRNVLAYALLNWPETLHKGPILPENPKWKSQLPLVYQHQKN